MNPNPHAQFSHPSFPLPSLNPNPNPNFFYSHPQSTQHGIPAFPLPAADLSATISSLDSLIRDSYHALDSLSVVLPLPQPSDNNSDTALIPCPFNSHHRVHPDSLFSHSLHCPSLPHSSHQDNLPQLNYPKTLKSSDQCQTEKSFLGSDSDLCLSLEHYYTDFNSNFFYRDCPGVVNFSADGVNRMFTLPLILAVECANFIFEGEREEVMDFEKFCCRILPSELWAIKAEVKGWNAYPCMYSYCVLRAILALGAVRECDLAIWVIANSPQYGIVIDAAMRDHIILLFRLFLKASLREARSKLKEVDPERTQFECPILVQALAWLESQLSVLYGTHNAKLFSASVLKKCILDAALSSLIFPWEQLVTKSPALEESLPHLDANGIVSRDGEIMKQLDTDSEDNRMVVKEKFITREVFVSQVAAAVAALHERSLLEEKLKAQIFPTLTRYQRMINYEHLSQRAAYERNNRSQYRPIIDHDGLPRQHSSNQETSKTKTKEELLAEERDYKRRRMSYRGKKVKRTTLQVMRDIIEEYMEEIKQAGGIGCFEKGITGEGSIPFELPSASEITTGFGKPEKRSYDSAGGSPNHSRRHTHSSFSIHSTTSKDISTTDPEKPRRSLQGYREYLEDHRGVIRDRPDRKNHSRSIEQTRSHGSRHRRERDDVEVTKTKYHDNRSSSQSNSHQKPKVRSERDKSENHSSKSMVKNTFEDRYDPSESRDTYEDEFSYYEKIARAGR